MALRRMVLRDFVIVHELELELHDGYTALTGETGAGKSILIDALQLVTGARADAGLIREGAQRTEISAEFDNTPIVDALLAEMTACCCDAAWTWLAKAGPGSTAARPRRSSCVQWGSCCWTSTASTPGKV